MRIRALLRGLMVVAACHTGAGCSGRAAPADAIAGSEWRLVELNGEPSGVGADDKPATLRLNSAAHRMSGFGGCNRMTGGYQLHDDSLRFDRVAMSMMACPDGMALEGSFAAALEATRTYRVTDRGLELIGESGTVARLERAKD